jgi:hypothetical protein
MEIEGEQFIKFIKRCDFHAAIHLDRLMSDEGIYEHIIVNENQSKNITVAKFIESAPQSMVDIIETKNGSYKRLKEGMELDFAYVDDQKSERTLELQLVGVESLTLQEKQAIQTQVGEKVVIKDPKLNREDIIVVKEKQKEAVIKRG